MSERETQCNRILVLLLAANGAWVPLPEILDLRIAMYTTRILELRRAGHVIENKIETDANGRKRSWYRLASEPAK
jgi:hypothetical protein